MRFFLFLFVLVGLSVPASADVFVWKDPQTGVSLSFPDRWRVTHNQKPDDILTIVAPQAQDNKDYAGCRMRVRDDRRFAIYPARFSGAIQRQNFGGVFLEDYLAEYNETYINEFRNNSGLARGVASFADVSFESVVPPKVVKRGIVYTSFYANRVNILECSVREDRFDYWKPIFDGIVRSVDFGQVTQDSPVGQYRDFLADRPIQIRGARAIEVYTF